MVEEREKCNKIIIFIFAIVVHTVSYLRRYCSGVTYFLRFETSHNAPFLVFGMTNAKYLAFGTPITNALIRTLFIN